MRRQIQTKYCQVALCISLKFCRKMRPNQESQSVLKLEYQQLSMLGIQQYWRIYLLSHQEPQQYFF